MVLFLEGQKEIGKSYLLREALLPYKNITAGYMVQRLFDDGIKVGFRVVTLEGDFPELDAQYSPQLSGLFISPQGRTLQPLEDAIVHTMNNLQGKSIILLDEVGGIELTSPTYKNALTQLLGSGLPVFGVIKSEENLNHTLRNTKNKEEYFRHYKWLRKAITNRGEILTLTKDNRQSIKEHIATLVKNISKGEAYGLDRL